MTVDRRQVQFGAGAVNGLDALVDGYGPERVLVVATESGLTRAGLGHWLDSPRHRLFSGFRPNPDLDDALAGCVLRDSWRPTVVVGVGGGSAMDTAKLVRALPTDRAAALRCLTGTPDGLSTAVDTLVLVPTTSGTGSEVTQFATVFDGDRKYSLDHPLAAATRSVVDPDLTAGCPPAVATSCAMDALCHSVESLWARRSTDGSRADALRALAGLVGPLGNGLKDTSPQVRERLARAALDAGAAINMTRTTAAHAFAYQLTRQYGVPHGVACLLNLQWLYAYNAEHLEAHCEDVRGRAHVRAQLESVAVAWGLTVAGMPAHFAGLLSDMGWSPRLSAYGVRESDLAAYIEAGKGSTARAVNNPVGLVGPLVLQALHEIY
ncbi:iron-containing alcohol dehydrogenase [Streptomyces sp. NPDC005786]|uniref:iron-containing alcohol dehydrogenase n=1 Tax=Streptomyces sp. NPDC005786 TaxID=3154891 RepID=UPI0033F447A9